MALSNCGRPHHVDTDLRNRKGLPSGPSISYQIGQQAGPTPRYGELFPCNNPTSPMYSEYSDRLRTYRNWNKGHIIDPELLAAAGLFFLGDRDRSKCYYCNGGLQNWESGDNPMEEHAKYFPQCEYVLARMGPDYVVELNERFPNLKRPTLSISSPQTRHHETQRRHRPAPNNSAVRVPTGNMQISNSPQTHISNLPQSHVSSMPQQSCGSSISQSHVSSMRQIEVDTCIQECNQIKQLKLEAIQFGFEKSVIERLTKSKFERTGAYHDSLSELIEDLVNDQQGDILPETNPMEVEYTGMSTVPAVTVCEPTSVTKSSNNVQNDSLRDQLQNALDETLCRSCRKRGRDCVFLDCGHLCCCYECGRTKTSCVICNARIINVIKIYKM